MLGNQQTTIPLTQVKSARCEVKSGSTLLVGGALLLVTFFGLGLRTLLDGLSSKSGGLLMLGLLLIGVGVVMQLGCHLVARLSFVRSATSLTLLLTRQEVVVSGIGASEAQEFLESLRCKLK